MMLFVNVNSFPCTNWRSFGERSKCCLEIIGFVLFLFLSSLTIFGVEDRTSTWIILCTLLHFFFLSFYVAPPLSFVFPSHTHKKKRLDTILWVISDSDLLSMPIPNRLDTKRIYGLFVFAFRRFPLMHVALCFFQIVLRLMLSLWVMNLRQKMKSTGSCILTRGKDWIVDMQQETHSSFPSHYE